MITLTLTQEEADFVRSAMERRHNALVTALAAGECVVLTTIDAHEMALRSTACFRHLVAEIIRQSAPGAGYAGWTQ